MQLSEVALQCKMISLESRNPTQSLEALSFRLPEVLTGVTNFFKGVFSSKPVQLNTVNHRSVMRILNKMTYEEASKFDILTPPGLAVTFEEYVGVLSKTQDVLEAELMSGIKDFSKWIGSLLTKPEQLANINANAIMFSAAVAKLDSGLEERAMCLANGDVTEGKFGGGFTNNASWMSTCFSVNKLVGSLATMDRHVVSRQLDDISVLLNTLTKRIKEDPVTYKVSGGQLEALSSSTYNLAKLVESMSMQTYAVASVVNALRDSSDWIVEQRK